MYMWFRKGSRQDSWTVNKSERDTAARRNVAKKKTSYLYATNVASLAAMSRKDMMWERGFCKSAANRLDYLSFVFIGFPLGWIALETNNFSSLRAPSNSIDPILIRRITSAVYNSKLRKQTITRRRNCIDAMIGRAGYRRPVSPPPPSTSLDEVFSENRISR